ncbi:hypothetical protein B0O99DRAFT_527682 [Bisporella sp. PMI_857]|nr:hypothetical protein B0O99DRAFT_527682 [Bisporella sp. PMI_857]
MVRVAIAGGSGGLGRTLAEAIAATTKHDLFVLSRETSHASAEKSPFKILRVDYLNPTQIAEVLRANNINTVISTIGILSEDTHRAQLNLIDGAVEAGTVTRFAPSDGYPFHLPGLEGYMSSQYKIAAFEKLRATKMECTRFIIGFLMDYYGFPAEKIDIIPLAVVLDVENCKAAIPAGGNDPITLTHSQTIGKFVAASLDLPKWPEKSWIIGDTMTWNEVLDIAEQARGQKFDVTYDSIESLQQSMVTELPANVPRYSIAPKPFMDGIMSLWSLGFAQRWFDLPFRKGDDGTLNELFPEIEVLTMKNFLNRCWGGGGDLSG